MSRVHRCSMLFRFKMADISTILDENYEDPDDIVFHHESQDFNVPRFQQDEELLTPCAKLQKYAYSDNVFNRQMVPAILLEIFRDASVDALSTDLPALMDIIARITNDKEASLRTDLLQRIPHIAAACAEFSYRVPALSNVVVDYLLPLLVNYLGDADNQVRQATHTALLTLMEQGLVPESAIEVQVCPKVLLYTHNNTLTDSHPGTVALMGKMVPLLGCEITERLFLKRFSELCSNQMFYIRKICASSFGEFCAVVGRNAYENVLLPCFLDLCADDTWGVRKACAEVVMPVSCACSPESRRNALAPAFGRLLQDQSRWVRMSAFQTLGPFISTFADPSIIGLAYNQRGELVLINPSGTEFRINSPAFTDASLKAAAELKQNFYQAQERGQKYSLDEWGDFVGAEEKQNENSTKNNLNSSSSGSSSNSNNSSSVNNSDSSEKETGSSSEQKSNSNNIEIVIGGGDSDKNNSENENENKNSTENENENENENQSESESKSDSDNTTTTTNPTITTTPTTTSDNNQNTFNEMKSKYNDYYNKLVDEMSDIINNIDIYQDATTASAAENDENEKTKNIENGNTAVAVVTTTTTTMIKKEPDDELNKYNFYQYWHVSPDLPLDPEIVQSCSTSSSSPDSPKKTSNNEENSFFNRLEDIHLNSSWNPIMDETLPHDKTKPWNGERENEVPAPPTPIEQNVVTQEIVPQILIDHFVSMTDPILANNTDNDMAYHCAFSLPAVALTLGRNNWFLLKRTCNLLASDMQYKTRKTIASSLHELVLILGPELASEHLLPIFDEFIKDLDEVRIGVLRHLADFLKLIGAEKRVLYLPRLEKFLITDNKWNWRFREELANQLLMAIPLFTPIDASKHIAFLAQELLCDKVFAVRQVALYLVTDLVHHVCGEPNLSSCLLLKLAEEFAHSKRWVRRQTFALLCSHLISNYALPSEQFATIVMPHLLDLSWDPVPNVRLVVSRTLARDIITHEYFSNVNNEQHENVNKVLKRLQSDKDRDVRQYAVPLVH